MLYRLIGQLFFARQQSWEQRKNGKILFYTLAFTLTLGMVMTKIIHLIYNHQK
jgi:hypothetical protein